MPHPITIPRLGWSMEAGVFTEWLKSPGDFVRAGDMIFVLEGEKAANEIESLDSGYLCVPADAPQPGATVAVGATIGFLLSEGEAAPSSVRSEDPSPTHLPQAASPSSAPAVSHPSPSTFDRPCIGESTLRLTPQQFRSRVAGPAARRLARELGIDLNAVVTPDPTGRVLREDVRRTADQRMQRNESDRSASHIVATPRARRRARELGVDWTRLAGTGRDGRVRERDVLASTMASGTIVAPFSDAMTSSGIPPTEPGRYAPASKLRLILAQRLSAGVHQAVPVTLTTKIDASALVAQRERLKIEMNNGAIPSYNDILIHHVAHTLRELPDLNACWYRDGIYTYEAIHIATAVDAPGGLLAPVVRDADRLSLPEIADCTVQLIAAARSGRLSQKQLTGGTFTISNLGMLGVDAFTPVLNLPQAAILGVGRIIEEPVVQNGQVVVGKTLTLSLTFDHRVLDGAPAARWLQRLSERLQTL